MWFFFGTECTLIYIQVVFKVIFYFCFFIVVDMIFSNNALTANGAELLRADGVRAKVLKYFS